jgi:hypothetical protein
MLMREERGVAIVIAAMAMTLVLALGTALILVSSSETMIAANFRLSAEALYAADAVLERAVSDLRGLADWNLALTGLVRSPFVDGPPTGVRRIAGGATIDLAVLVNLANCRKGTPCTDAEMNAVTAERPWGPNNPRWQLFAFGWVDQMAGGAPRASSFYVVAMVADDGSENDGDASLDGSSRVLPNPGRGIIMVRADAFGPRASHHGVEATIERFLMDELVPTGPTGLRMLSWRED